MQEEASRRSQKICGVCDALKGSGLQEEASVAGVQLWVSGRLAVAVAVHRLRR